jgi:hypothetical protein
MLVGQRSSNAAIHTAVKCRVYFLLVNWQFKHASILASFDATKQHLMAHQFPRFAPSARALGKADLRPDTGLDSDRKCSFYVLISVETLKDALSAGWRVFARCIDGRVEYTRSSAKCHCRAELSLETLVWTRGRNMPISGPSDRMMCPRCGNRRVSLIFKPPANARAQR